MKLTNSRSRREFFATIRLGLLMILLGLSLPLGVAAQVIREVNGQMIVSGQPMPSSPSQPGSSSPAGGSASGGGTWVPSEPLSTNNAPLGTNNEDIQLSFQGANIDMIAQWLAKTTGKTVVPHPQVQCQLTIISGQKVSTREAINIVYRALGMQGFTVVESSRSILIVPEGKEPKMSPEIVDAKQPAIPDGRQRLTRVFSLTHVQAAQIRDKVRSVLTEKATLDVDEHQNQIIITDYNDNIRVVGKLIEALDSDKPVDMAVRVIPLKHISGADLAKELAPLYQRMNSGAPKDSIDVVADDRSNALIVFSSQAGFNALAQVISMLDTEDAQQKATETFLLKNADAQDVAKQLQDLSQSSSVNSRYIYYYSEPGSDQGSSKKMSVVADKRRNAVIVQAPPTEMNAVRKMIEQLDEPVAGDSLAPKIYHLKYASAADVEDVLNELFLKKQQQRSYYDYYYGDYGDSSSTSSSDVGRLYGKVRITSEPYSNTLIVTANSKESLDAVESVLRELDAPSDAGESTLRIGLRFAKAEEVAKNLNILFAKNGSPPLRPVATQNQPNTPQPSQAQQQTSTTQSDYSLTEQSKQEGYYPWLGGQADSTRSGDSRSASRAVSDLVGRVRVVADPRINSVMVTANVHYFPEVLKLINDLDAVTDQVLIDARIVEVSSDFMDRLGVRYSPDGSQVFTADDFDNSILAHATAQYMKGFGGTTSVNTPSSSTVAQALTSLRSGVLDNSVSMDFVVQFLRKTTEATVMGEPQITINDNELGRLFVGQEVPRPDNTQVNAISGGQNTTVTYKQAGVTLEVTPHINSTGDVQLRVHVESSTLSTQQILNAPVFDTRQFRTDLTAKNGQTLVLGGIIQKQLSDTIRKTIILGDIPGLGWAFRKKDKITHEVQLMVFLRPTVIHTPEDAQNVLDTVNQQAPRMKKWQDDSAGEMKH